MAHSEHDVIRILQHQQNAGPFHAFPSSSCMHATNDMQLSAKGLYWKAAKKHKLNEIRWKMGILIFRAYPKKSTIFKPFPIIFKPVERCEHWTRAAYFLCEQCQSAYSIEIAKEHWISTNTCVKCRLSVTWNATHIHHVHRQIDILCNKHHSLVDEAIIVSNNEYENMDLRGKPRSHH